MSHQIEYVYLANGEKVPKACVDALDEFELRWPGASFVNARAGLAIVVVKAYKKEMKKSKRNRV